MFSLTNEHHDVKKFSAFREKDTLLKGAHLRQGLLFVIQKAVYMILGCNMHIGIVLLPSFERRPSRRMCVCCGRTNYAPQITVAVGNRSPKRVQIHKLFLHIPPRSIPSPHIWDILLLLFFLEGAYFESAICFVGEISLSTHALFSFWPFLESWYHLLVIS